MSRTSVPRFKVYKYLVEATSIPLAILLITFVLSGYCLVKSEAVEAATFSLLTYPVCIAIHTSRLLRVLLVTIGLLHGVPGFILLFSRYMSSELRKFVEVLIIAAGAIIAIEILFLELV